MFQVSTKRTNVTVDDRRAVFVAGMARNKNEMIAVPHEMFARNMLKDRLGWPHRDPAPESVKQAAKELAASLSQAVKQKLDAAEAKAKLAAEKAAAKTAVTA
jgi:hypothetical protein